MSQVQTEFDQTSRSRTEEQEAAKVHILMMQDELEDAKRQKEQVHQEHQTTISNLNKSLSLPPTQNGRDFKTNLEKLGVSLRDNGELRGLLTFCTPLTHDSSPFSSLFQKRQA